MHTPGPKHVVRGQYGPGFVEGVEVRGYREEEGVAPGSMTETFVAAKLFVDNWRWADTPFYVRMGKRLARRETTIAIQFKRAPHPPFADTADEESDRTSYSSTCSRTKDLTRDRRQGARPGHDDSHGPHGLPLRRRVPRGPARGVRASDPRRDARRRDALHALRRDRGAVGARRRDRRGVAARPAAFPNYPAGTWGPSAADELMQRDGRSWRSH